MRSKQTRTCPCSAHAQRPCPPSRANWCRTALYHIAGPGRPYPTEDTEVSEYQQELTPSELARRLNLQAPTVTHHLKELRLAGLINVSVRGQERLYRARLGALIPLAGSMKGFLKGTSHSGKRWIKPPCKAQAPGTLCPALLVHRPIAYWIFEFGSGIPSGTGESSGYPGGRGSAIGTSLLVKYLFSPLSWYLSFLQPPLDIDEPALLQVSLGDLGQAIPCLDIDPLRGPPVLVAGLPALGDAETEVRGAACRWA